LPYRHGAEELRAPTSSKARYGYGQNQLSDPTLRNLVIENCKKSAASPETLQKLAAFMSAPVSKVKDLYCRRIITAYATGKISYEDYARFNENGGASPSIVRAIRGR
jgi:hypothetical protein